MHVHHAASFVSVSAMWMGMMTAMMAPTVWPWVSAYHRLGSHTALFAGGYFVAWAVYSIAAAGLQILIGPPSSAIAATILISAGLFQFASIKAACLTHCRNPFTYFLSKWRNGPAGGFHMGFGHGLFCVACCWALMLTTLAVGMTSLWWMAALALTAFAEQVLPFGDRLRKPIGVALIVMGLLTAVRPA